MSRSRPSRRAHMRTALQQKVIWPVLDLRDKAFHRGEDKEPLYDVAPRVPRRVRIRWAVLDAWDKLPGPHKGRRRARMNRVRAAEIAAVPLVLLAIVGYVMVSGDQGSKDGSESASAKAVERAAAPAPPRIEVAGVHEDSDAVRERRAKRAAKRRAARRHHAAEHRRTERRHRAAAKRRAAARKRAKKRAARARSAPVPAASHSSTPAPTTPASQGSSGGGSSQNSAPAPAPAPTRPPSSGGGGGGGGGGGSSSPPRQPQSNPGVEFDDQG